MIDPGLKDGTDEDNDWEPDCIAGRDAGTGTRKSPLLRDGADEDGDEFKALETTEFPIID